jgi:hypothetical protein
MSTRNLPGCKGQPEHGADNLIAICEPTVLKMWEPRHLTTLWAFMACYRDSFTFTYIQKFFYSFLWVTCLGYIHSLPKMKQLLLGQESQKICIPNLVDISQILRVKLCYQGPTPSVDFTCKHVNSYSIVLIS